MEGAFRAQSRGRQAQLIALMQEASAEQPSAARTTAPIVRTKTVGRDDFMNRMKSHYGGKRG